MIYCRSKPTLQCFTLKLTNDTCDTVCTHIQRVAISSYPAYVAFLPWCFVIEDIQIHLQLQLATISNNHQLDVTSLMYRVGFLQNDQWDALLERGSVLWENSAAATRSAHLVLFQGPNLSWAHYDYLLFNNRCWHMFKKMVSLLFFPFLLLWFTVTSCSILIFNRYDHPLLSDRWS